MTNLPITGRFYVTATYGQEGKYWANGHKGIDLVPDNPSIYCSCDGIVRKVAYDAGGWGQYVSIGDDQGRRHIFCHLVNGSVKVKEGQRVTRSTIIGTMGATGNVSGIHLHFQLQQGEKVIDPTPYLGIPNKKGEYHSENYQIGGDPVADPNKYRDDAKIPEWAKASVYEVKKKGLMVGDANNNFRPNDPLTRAEMAVILGRLK
jgi:hypothetical protein